MDTRKLFAVFFAMFLILVSLGTALAAADGSSGTGQGQQEPQGNPQRTENQQQNQTGPNGPNYGNDTQNQAGPNGPNYGNDTQNQAGPNGSNGPNDNNCNGSGISYQPDETGTQNKKSNDVKPNGEVITQGEEIASVDSEPVDVETTGEDWTLLIYYSVDYLNEGNGDRDRDRDRDSTGDGSQGSSSGGDGGSNGAQSGDQDGSGDGDKDQIREGNGNYPTDDPSGTGNDSLGDENAPRNMTQNRNEDEDCGRPVLSLETSMEIELAALQEATTPLSNGINIIVLVDKLSENGTEIFKIEDGQIIDIESRDEENTADSAVLEDFVNYSLTEYPADKTMLVIKGEGLGWRGICVDTNEMGDKDIMTVDKIAGVLEGRGIDILVLEGDNMAMIEVAYELRNAVPYLVATQSQIQEDGISYGMFIADLVNDTGMSIVDFATEIANDHVTYYNDLKSGDSDNQYLRHNDDAGKGDVDRDRDASGEGSGDGDSSGDDCGGSNGGSNGEQSGDQNGTGKETSGGSYGDSGFSGESSNSGDGPGNKSSTGGGNGLMGNSTGGSGDGQEYIRAAGGQIAQNFATMSVFNLSKIEDVIDMLSDFADTLADLDLHNKVVSAARDASMVGHWRDIDDYDYLADIYRFACANIEILAEKELGDYPDLNDTVDNFTSAFDDAKIIEVHSDKFHNTNGLSIWFPGSLNKYNVNDFNHKEDFNFAESFFYEDTELALNFIEDCTWIDFLMDYYGDHHGGGAENQKGDNEDSKEGNGTNNQYLSGKDEKEAKQPINQWRDQYRPQIQQGIEDGTVVKECNISVKNGKTYINSCEYQKGMDVEIEEQNQHRLQLKASAEYTEGKVLILNVEKNTFQVENSNQLKVKFDGKEINEANIEDVIDGQGIEAQFAAVIGDDGGQYIVYIPHFSEHVITIEVVGITESEDVSFISAAIGAAFLTIIILILVVVRIGKYKRE